MYIEQGTTRPGHEQIYDSIETDQNRTELDRNRTRQGLDQGKTGNRKRAADERAEMEDNQRSRSRLAAAAKYMYVLV